MKLTLSTFVLAISLYAYGQEEYIITLRPGPQEVQTRPFYIDSVVDNRVNKNNLGIVLLRAFNKPAPANFNGKFTNELHNYLKSVCSEKGNQIPLIASFDELNISELMGSLREDGIAHVKISFYKKDDKSLLGTFESTEKSHWAFDVTEQHANLIKQAILNCLDQLSAKITLVQVLQPSDTTGFTNFHGLRQVRSNEEYFEGEGHDIFIKTAPYKLDKKGMKKLSRKYDLKSYQSSTDSLLKLTVFKKQRLVNEVMAHHSLYLIPGSSGFAKIIGFANASEQNIDLERKFVQTYRSGAIPDYVYTESVCDSIDFVGRTIQLDGYCHWMGPHNVQCPNLGQMNWSVFESQQEAEAYRDSHIAITKNKNMINVIDETWMPIKFEGVETKALRVKVKVKVPKFAMDGSNTLIVYFVTANVRDKFVTAVLSQYTYDPNSNALAPLLGEVLTLQSADGVWQQDHKISTVREYYEADTVDVPEKKPEEYSSVKFEVGTWIPIGNMSAKVDVSPSFGIYGGWINNPDLPFRLDIGLSLFIPLNTKPFDYWTKDSTFVTKLGAPAGFLGIHVTTKKVLANRTVIDYVDQVFGVGVGIFPTTTEKPKKNPEDRDSNYDFDTLNLNYGLTFRKKIWKHQSIGLVIRYNFTPTTWFNSSIKSGFGNSSFTTGIELRL